MKSFISKLVLLFVVVLSFSNEGNAQFYRRAVAPEYVPRIQYLYFSSFDSEITLSGIGIENRVVIKNAITGRVSFNYMKYEKTNEEAIMGGLLFDIPINSEPNRTGYFLTVGVNFLFDVPEGGQLQVGVGTSPRISSDEEAEGLGGQIAPQLGFGGQIMLLEDIIYIYGNGNYLPYDSQGVLFTVGIDIRIPNNN